MTSKNIRAPLLYYIKLCASFQTHWWIQTAVTVQKRSIWVKIGDFLSSVTLKFDGWPWQTIGHLFYATSSFVNHFKAIGEFKLEWQSGNAQFRSKSAMFVPCDLEISRMTLKNNRAHLLCYFKIWASFHSHLWIQTGDTVRKCPIWVEINDIFSGVTLKFDRWPWKSIGTATKQYRALCIISSPYVKSNWSYRPETANLVFDLCNLDFWPLTLNFCMDITSVIGNHYWKFHDDSMMGT